LVFDHALLVKFNSRSAPERTKYRVFFEKESSKQIGVPRLRPFPRVNNLVSSPAVQPLGGRPMTLFEETAEQGEIAERDVLGEGNQLDLAILTQQPTPFIDVYAAVVILSADRYFYISVLR
jgi:hypothetical protein